MKSNDLTKQLNHYGYDLIDYKNKPGYEQRKGAAWAVIDRRNGQLCCVYATKEQIKNWMEATLKF